ncbi:PhoPQ-activated pathogenicity-related family protein [Zavarzinella formosa]|uniref:PhoPQ-activated pathogenicity-related family protein n=1 Tax=Zavarzinella formosa TaxID=360055 RepID=UPI0002D630F0|nr:PhoPQ-activated protein PqaA family protein [Zavarzinella formosa]
MIRILPVLVCLVLCPITADAGLLEYVKKPDDSFKWNLKNKTVAASGTSYQIEMVSQTWEGIKWDHILMVYVPEGVKPGESMMLFNDGGKPDPLRGIMGFEIAKRAQIPVAFLYGIPNQPLFDGKKEDALIAETFVRFLKTEDEDWPLLFPMTKSLVRGMDVLQALSKEEWKNDLKTFVVSGASKRGWTSWLTGAADPRVKAIAPLVIDTLNFGKQIPHQFKSFGKPSDMVKDYTQRGLIPIPAGKAAEKLWQMVDPWMYRESLKMPKMIINGANDPYWSLDALNLYWDDLQGDKWVLYVPNAGHGLEQIYGEGKKDRNRALSTLALFARQQVLNKPMPKLSWKHEDADGQMRLTATTDVVLKACRLWVADAPTRDFRKQTWTEAPAKIDGKSATGLVAKPEKDWRAFYMECEYEDDGKPYYLSTQIRMDEAKK